MFLLVDGTEAAASTIASVLADIGTIVTEAISWMGDYMTVVTDNPLLLVFVCLPVVGLGIGLLKRMISL